MTLERPGATQSEISMAERLVEAKRDVPNELASALLDEIRRLKRAAGEGGTLRHPQEDAPCSVH